MAVAAAAESVISPPAEVVITSDVTGIESIASRRPAKAAARRHVSTCADPIPSPISNMTLRAARTGLSADAGQTGMNAIDVTASVMTAATRSKAGRIRLCGTVHEKRARIARALLHAAWLVLHARDRYALDEIALSKEEEN
jgi:hypothetical protein